MGGAQWCGLRPLEAMLLPQSSPDAGRRWSRSPICDCFGGFVFCLKTKVLKPALDHAVKSHCCWLARLDAYLDLQEENIASVFISNVYFQLLMHKWQSFNSPSCDKNFSL